MAYSEHLLARAKALQNKQKDSHMKLLTPESTPTTPSEVHPFVTVPRSSLSEDTRLPVMTTPFIDVSSNESNATLVGLSSLLYM
jgi:hypothetical protein